MLESERVVEEHRGKENSARGFSLVSITLAAAMVLVGNLYWYPSLAPKVLTYMRKGTFVAEMAILAKKIGGKKCVNLDRM